MTKTRKLFLAGICPLVIGYLFNFMMYLPISGLFLSFLSLLVLAVWGYSAYRLTDNSKNVFVQSIFMCAFGLFMLALVLYQELVLRQYWGNFIGSGTQLFFLPFLSITSTLFPSVLTLHGAIRVWPLYIVEWVVLFVVCIIGFSIGKKVHSHRTIR